MTTIKYKKMKINHGGEEEMRELFSQLWNLFHQVIYRNKFHISGTYII
jgi:hypothetical protein